MPNNTTKTTTNHYELVVLELRSDTTGERGFFVGESMLFMDDDIKKHIIAIDHEEEKLVIAPDAPISDLINRLRQKIGMT